MPQRPGDHPGGLFHGRGAGVIHRAIVTLNLQPMCHACNGQKNHFPDAAWSRRLYFDGPIETEALRASQNDFCYAKIMEFSNEFARPS